MKKKLSDNLTLNYWLRKVFVIYTFIRFVDAKKNNNLNIIFKCALVYGYYFKFFWYFLYTL